ncbi:DUF4265 domain-containing protein [Parasalinivibrio latis]|uniref:DUF4265 domain-containing protein n=1 Tax=Parasalinivibrio latis TaxID=2952610 RepID=UPI0030E4C1F5
MATQREKLGFIMSKREKIRFPIEEGKSEVEVMYAKPAGHNVYVLDNSPFYAFGISFCDEFIVKTIDGVLEFDKILSRSGHSTYRIRIPNGKNHDYFLENWKELMALGCTFEGSSANSKRLYAIDVPPSSNIIDVYNTMQKIEDLGIWEFEEGHYCDPDDIKTVN